MDVHAASRPVWPITIPRGLYLSGEHWGSHEQSTWSIFMCYNLSISHQSEYIPFLKSSIAVGFTTVIRHESPHISTIFHCWDGADQTWMPLPLSDWPISYFWLFYEHRTPSNSVVTHHISSLSPFRLLYIELGRYLYIFIYIYMWICIAPCLDKHAIYDFIIYIYRYAYRYRYKCIWNVYIHTSRYIQ